MSRFHSFELERSIASGGHVRWETMAQVDARVSPLRRRPSLRQGNDVVLATHEVRFRHRLGVRAGMRLRHPSRLLLIHSVDAVGRREGWLSCLCEEQQRLAPEVS